MQGYLAALSASSYSYVSMLQRFAPLMNEGGAAISLTYIASERIVPGALRGDRRLQYTIHMQLLTELPPSVKHQLLGHCLLCFGHSYDFCAIQAMAVA